MINPGSIARNGYLGNTLSVATDGYIAPEGALQFISNFVGEFMNDFVGNFMINLTDEDDL